ncbi:flagellar hook-length control protein FliK, partial [Sphingomonas sp. CLY1604]|uniref:flagellar hook-length control protein FliK n=1 Tax=Sphingomonas sp. CLY1604 TaxID=3457786 RepID=UPI003FD86565
PAASPPSPPPPPAAIAEPAQPVVDIRQQAWPTAMIDHIERLRDAANANDTRIRLIPDALGPIDVAVKTVGDAIHVRFAAQDPATRALIEDAQPKLAAIAEDRGLRIAQTVIEAAPAAPSQNQTQNQPQSGQSQANGQQQSASNAGQNGAPAMQGQSTQGQSAQAQSGQQQQPRQQPAPAPRQPDRPARARADTSDAASNGRIA